MIAATLKWCKAYNTCKVIDRLLTEASDTVATVYYQWRGVIYCYVYFYVTASGLYVEFMSASQKKRGKLVTLRVYWVVL